MAKKKIITASEEIAEVQVVPRKIQHVSVDLAREDLNNLARTLNLVIDVINAKE